MSALSKPVPVRFHPDTRQKLTAVAEKFGLKTADVIRMAVDQSLADFAAADKIIIPRRRASVK